MHLPTKAKPIDSCRGSCYPRAMRTRIFLLVLAFACLPSCKKAATPEQASNAEQEIDAIAVKIAHATLNLKMTEAPGEALAYKSQLDDLKAELLAAREKNKDKIPLERSQQLADQSIEETTNHLVETNRKHREEYQKDLRRIDEGEEALRRKIESKYK